MRTTICIFFMLLSTALFAQKLQPSETAALIKISVSDMYNKPRKNDIVILKATTSNKNYECITDDKGYAEVLLPKGDTYLITYKQLVDEKEFSSITIPQKSGLMTSTITIQYEPATSITLENVYFDTNQSSLKPASFKSLDELADFMKLKTSLVIEVAGHTDDVGDSLFNKKLSQARAESVRNYLIKKGISAERLIAKGYGEDEPIAYNDNEAGRQKNRRTEIRVISE